MYCPNCRSELPEGANFCHSCSYDLSPIKTASTHKGKTPYPIGDDLDGIGKTTYRVESGGGREQEEEDIDRLGNTLKGQEIEADSLKAGMVFGGRYEILSEGKKGGMGAVYRAKDRKLLEECALKVIHPSLSRTEQVVSRFRQEVSIARKLIHKNIVRVYDLSEQEGKEYFTMEWIEGKSLRDEINERKAKGKAYSIGEAVEIIGQLCDGLEEAHKYTVHRDIKPENILIRELGEGKREIKLTDFGIAKMLSASEFMSTSMQMGTPYYMAPEQKVDSGEVDKRADIYAVGVVLFELLTLENTIGLEMPSEINPEIPKEIDGIIKKAVATRPDNRYRDVVELRDELKKLISKAEKEREAKEEERRKAEIELRREEEEEAKRKEQEARLEAERIQREQEEERQRIEASKGQQKKKKNIWVYFIIGFIVLFGIGVINQKIEQYRASQKAEELTTTSENIDTKQKSGEIFLFDNFNFPLTITSFIKEFGKPEQTIIQSPDIPSSIGQLHEWFLSQQNIRLFVLGDSYASSIDYKAKSRFFQISKYVSGKTSNLKGLWDIKLDDSDKQVIDKLTNIARQQKDYTVELKINGPPHLYFLEESKVSHHHILIKKGDYFLYFVINSRGTLESIIKSAFDTSAAG